MYKSWWQFQLFYIILPTVQDGKIYLEYGKYRSDGGSLHHRSAWLSFRYFGKTYANLQEALYFNGHWETFGGINWNVNKKLSLGVSVINIFNEKGAKGTISGSELITKQEAGKYDGKYMSGSYLRPFTVEFSAGIKF